MLYYFNFIYSFNTGDGLNIVDSFNVVYGNVLTHLRLFMQTTFGFCMV